MVQYMGNVDSPTGNKKYFFGLKGNGSMEKENNSGHECVLGTPLKTTILL